MEIRPWVIRKHPNYRFLYYIDTGDGALPATVTDDELKTSEKSFEFRLASRAPEMYRLLLDVLQLEFQDFELPKELKSNIEGLFYGLDQKTGE